MRLQQTLLLLLHLLLSFFLLHCTALASVTTQIASDSSLKQQLNFAENFLARAKEAKQALDLGEITVECALCGLALNEIEGFIAENISETVIEEYLDTYICSFLSGELKSSCESLVERIPSIIAALEKEFSVSVVCVDLGFCATPFPDLPDPVPVPHFVLDLDQPPKQRWHHICSLPQYQQNAQYLHNTVAAILPDGGKLLEGIGKQLNAHLPKEYAEEIQGCATDLGIPYGWATLFNLGYEISDACTSIVAESADGKILHARNLDFWAGMGFTDTLKNMTAQIDVQKKGKTVFSSTTFVGYVGVLSGMKPNAFSVTIDTRFYPGGIGELFYEIIAAITEKNASMVSFLARDAFTKDEDFTSAVDRLSNGELIADVYFIVAGVKSGEGAVISRNRMNATNVWMLQPPQRWFEVETNYDHWNPAPWYDDRRKPANDGMNALGQKDVSLEGMYKVLSTKPVFNIQTTYSILACPADGSYKTFVRNCPYPCVE